MSEANYGEIVCTWHSPTVDEAPDRSLVSLELVANSGRQLIVARDRLCVGHTPDGLAVWYRVTGWDTAQGALIVEREAAEQPEGSDHRG